jgi:hypothetical protein
MDDNLVVREVPTPFSGEMVDITSSSSEDIEVSPARDDDLNLTLRVPYSRLHGELSTFFNVFLLLRFVSCHGFTFSFLPFSLHFFFFFFFFFFFNRGINEDYGREGTSASLPLGTGGVGLSEGNTISAAEGLTQFLEDSTKEISIMTIAPDTSEFLRRAL